MAGLFWGHIDPKVSAFTTVRFVAGVCGACHRREPVGGAAYRILTRVSLTAQVIATGGSCSPLPDIELRRAVVVALVDAIAQIDGEAPVAGGAGAGGLGCGGCGQDGRGKPAERHVENEIIATVDKRGC